MPENSLSEQSGNCKLPPVITLRVPPNLVLDTVTFPKETGRPTAQSLGQRNKTSVILLRSDSPNKKGKGVSCLNRCAGRFALPFGPCFATVLTLNKIMVLFRWPIRP